MKARPLENFMLYYNDIVIMGCIDAINTVFHTNKTALMHPSFSGLFVTWAYLPAVIIIVMDQSELYH